MVQNFRHGEILAIARAEGKVLVEELARRFGVTRQTVRRDLAELCDAGHLTRVHGGAVPLSAIANIGYEARRVLDADAKERIGRAAAAAIPDDSSLFLNIGTTTEAVARALMGHRNLLVVTNNLNAANILAANPAIEVVVTGGVLRRADGGLVGDMTLEAVRNFKVDQAVIGASAVDRDGDLLDYDPREVRVTRALMERSRTRLLVADASKFRRSAPVRIGSLAAVERFFTSAPPPPPLDALCREWGVEVIVA